MSITTIIIIILYNNHDGKKWIDLFCKTQWGRNRTWGAQARHPETSWGGRAQSTALRSRIGSKIQIIIMRGIRIAGKHPLVVICETPPAFFRTWLNPVQISKIWPHFAMSYFFMPLFLIIKQIIPSGLNFAISPSHHSMVMPMVMSSPPSKSRWGERPHGEECQPWGGHPEELRRGSRANSWDGGCWAMGPAMGGREVLPMPSGYVKIAIENGQL